MWFFIAADKQFNLRSRINQLFKYIIQNNAPNYHIAPYVIITTNS